MASRDAFKGSGWRFHGRHPLLKIIVPGEPRGKARARSRYIQPKGRTGFIVNYTPAKTRSYEGELSFYASKAMNGRDLLEGPLTVTIDAVFSIPQSWSRVKWQRAMSGSIRPTGKPDADNVLKILDGLNKIVWRDDSQIVDARIRKFYGSKPSLTIAIMATEVVADGLKPQAAAV